MKFVFSYKSRFFKIKYNFLIFFKIFSFLLIIKTKKKKKKKKNQNYVVLGMQHHPLNPSAHNDRIDMKWKLREEFFFFLKAQIKTDQISRVEIF